MPLIKIIKYIFIFLLFISNNSFAYAPFSGQHWYSVKYPELGDFDYPTKACSAIAGHVGGNFSGLGQHWTGTSCSIHNVDGKSGTTGFTLLSRNLGCTAGGTLNQSQNDCVCSAGFVDTGSSCIPEPENDPCELLATHCAGIEGTKQYWNKSGKAGGDWTCRSATAVMGQEMFPGCTRGCMGENYGSDSSIQNDAGEWFSQGQAKMTGATCDPGVVDDLNAVDPDYEKEETPKKSEAPDSSCPNGFKGEVNGVSVCVPPKASSGVTEKEVKDNGDGTKTNTKTEVKCEKGKCEVTKTSTTVNNTTNTTVGGSSSTTTVDKKAFCAANNTADVCKNEHGESEGGGKFGGNCSAGFTCEGDAIQCSIAKEQHKRACEVFDEKNPDYLLYGREKGKQGIQRGESEDGGESHDLAGLIKTESLIGSGSCIQNLTVQFMGKPVTIPFSSLCPYLQMLGNILVAVGMLMAIRIVGVR